MKKLFFILLLIGTSIAGCKKDKSRIFTGHVKDGTTDVNLERARVAAFSVGVENVNSGTSDLALIDQVYTDAEGYFELDLTGKEGKIMLYVTADNYFSTDLYKYVYPDGSSATNDALLLDPISHLKLNFMLNSPSVTSANLLMNQPNGVQAGISLGGSSPTSKTLLLTCKGNQDIEIYYTYSTYGSSGLIASGSKTERFYCFANDSTAYDIKF